MVNFHTKKEADIELEGAVKVKLLLGCCLKLDIFQACTTKVYLLILIRPENKIIIFVHYFTGYVCQHCNRKFSQVWEVRYMVYVQ